MTIHYFHESTGAYIEQGRVFSLDEIQYPANWLDLTNDEEKAAIGLVPVAVVDPGEPAESALYDRAEVFSGATLTVTWTRKPDEEVEAITRTIVRQKIDALWRAADAYTSGFISGVAVGLLTLGQFQQKPKALAVTAWSSAVWDAYYSRKALVTVSSVDDLDFSSFGPIPHSVPELRAELGL